MGEVSGFLPVYTSREFDPRWFCVWEIFVLLSWGASGGIYEFLDSQSLFVLIRQHNLEVSSWVDHRLCLFEIILSLNNKNLTKSQNLYVFGGYVQAVGAEGGAMYHQPENNSDWEQGWAERPVWKLCMGTPLKIRLCFWKFSFGWASLHIWQLPLPSPLPRTLQCFQNKGGWPPAPPSSPLEATSETSAKSPDVLSSLSVHLQALEPALPCATVRQILLSCQGWEEWQGIQPASPGWTDWLSQGGNQSDCRRTHQEVFWGVGICQQVISGW